MAGLNERREDVLLVARHLLRRIAEGDPHIGERFFEGWDGKRGEPRIGADLARALLLHTYATHARELESILWKAMGTSPEGTLELTPATREALGVGAPASAAPEADVGRAEIEAALAKHGGVRDKAWRELGLPSRHALHRLMKKHGLGGK